MFSINKKAFSFIAVLIPLALFGCSNTDSSGQKNASESESTDVSDGQNDTADARSSKKKDFVVTLNTTMGEMTLILYDETPIHKANFIKLAKEGLYDGVIFHRVIKNFMVQGGGIDMGDNKDKYKDRQQLPAEFVPSKFHKKGALAAARTSDQVNPERKSSWCQFYLVQGQVVPKEQIKYNQGKFNTAMRSYLNKPEHKAQMDSLQSFRKANDQDGYQACLDALVPMVEKEENVVLTMPQERVDAYSTIGGTPHLDDQYTVFGEVIKGLEVIDAIADVKTAPGDKPLEDVKIISAKVEEMRKKKITKLYGYEY